MCMHVQSAWGDLGGKPHPILATRLPISCTMFVVSMLHVLDAPCMGFQVTVQPDLISDPSTHITSLLRRATHVAGHTSIAIQQHACICC